MKVRDCMCSKVYSLKPENTVKECATLMCNEHVGCVPVCDGNNCVIGLVTDRDVILRSIACNKDVNSTPIRDIMTCKICSCTPDAEVETAEKLMSENHIRRLPVIEGNKVIGIITLGDLAKNKKVSNKEVSDTLEKICNCHNHNAE